MFFFYKLNSYSLLIASLIVSPLAWSENDCSSPECSQYQTQLELLRFQIKEANSKIKKLETVLSTAKQEISVLQNANLNKASSNSSKITGFQSKVNGRGFRYSYTK